MTDADPDLPLLQALAAGDAEACARLLDRHLPRLHAFVARYLGDASEAEDVCQEAFLALWKQAPRWRPGGARVSTWLYRVASNACRDRKRRAPVLSIEGIEPVAGKGSDPEALAIGAARIAALQQALHALPPAQAQALVLCHHQGWSQREAAAVLGVSEVALESLLARARRRLREQLEESAEGGAP